MENRNMSRRDFIRKSIVGGGIGGALVSSGILAQAVGELCGITTPQQAEGPFYPVRGTTGQDADLTSHPRSQAPALGQKIFLKGTVVDAACAPVAGAVVEIWQACASGRYNHPSDPNTAPLDPNFQYSGRVLSGTNGEFSFLTILPGAYPADVGWIRPPHIHVKVEKLSFLELTTQLYFAGNALNSADKILSRLSDPEKAKVILQTTPSLVRPGVLDAEVQIAIEKA